MIRQFDRSLVQYHHVDRCMVNQPDDLILEVRLDCQRILIRIKIDCQVIVAHRANLPSHLRTKQVHQADPGHICQDRREAIAQFRCIHKKIIA
jgi:hypothetical protein